MMDQIIAMDNKREESTIDIRLEFLGEYLLRTFNLRIDKWNKFISSDEKHLVFRFFDTPIQPFIIFSVTTAGKLTCSFTYPADYKTKLVYCLRYHEEKITMENFREITCLVEISPKVLTDICLLSNEVFCPMLCNPQNQKGWPKVVKNDVMKHINDLRSLMHQINGDLTSQVILPIPTGIEDFGHATFQISERKCVEVDLQQKTNIEGTIIKWARVVHDLLQENFYTAFNKQKLSLPLDEINYYQQRLRNMEGIYSQLRDPRVKYMAKYLEETNSVYLGCFKTMLTNVVAAIVECRDICVYQSPLVKHFKNFEATEFIEVKSLIRQMLHCLGLLWGQCRYFCQVERLLPLLQKISNLVILQCSNSIDPPSIFQGKPDEQLLKLRQALATLKYFIESFKMTQRRVPSLFPPGLQPVRWLFDFELVFKRFSVYMQRLRMIEKILDAAVEIFKLEKLEFSGIRGKILRNESLKILEKYSQTYQNLGNISYDPADPEDIRFNKDYEEHMKFLEDIDSQLASVFNQGFDDCYNLEDIFKLFQCVGDLFHHRPIIKAELQSKLSKLVDLMHANLDAVEDILDEEMKGTKAGKDSETRMVDPHMPTVASVLWWVDKLRRRITKPMEKFLIIEDHITDSDGVTFLKKKNNEILGYLNDLENRLFKAWVQTIPEIFKTHLAKNLIYRDPPFVRNNFSPELMMLLREIKYMRHLDKQGIPLIGLELFNKSHKLQADLIQLNCALEWYNAILEGSHETELALIKKDMGLIDQLISRGAEQLTWKDDSTDMLQQRVLTAQNNVRRGLENIAAWGDKPLYNVYDDELGLLDIKNRHSKLISRRNKIIESHAEFQVILKDNFKLFFNVKDEKKEEEETLEEANEFNLDDEEKVLHMSKLQEIEKWRIQYQLETEERQRINMKPEAIKKVCRKACRLKREAKIEDAVDDEVPSLTTVNGTAMPEPAKLFDAEDNQEMEKAILIKQWPEYVKYIDELVSAHIIKAIKSSIEFFEQQTNMEEERSGVPFVNVIAEFRDPVIYFSPSLDFHDSDGLYNILNGMMKDMFLQATFFPRIDPDVVRLSTYEVVIAYENAMIDLYYEILKRVEISITDIIGYSSKYEKYAPLWQEDRQEVLNVFLKYGRYISSKELEEYISENGAESPEQKPILEAYKIEIQKCNAMYEEVAGLPTSYLANGWLNLDLTRLNQSIMNIICKWSNIYKMDLKERVNTSLDNLEKFINNAYKELTIELVEGDYDGLLRVMSILNDVRLKMDAGTDQLFEPIRDIIDILKEYEVELSEETYEQLDTLPEKWHSLVQLATMTKHSLTPLKAARASFIAKRCSQVNQRLAMYREQFKNKEIFMITCNDPYKQMDEVNLELIEFERNINSLKHSCELFDVQSPDEKNLMACRHDLKLLKQLWDYYFLVMGTINCWKTSPWDEIDINVMDQECKRLAKDLRQFDKDLRSWEPYGAIDTTLKNLMISLRTFTDLKTLAVEDKDEHWLEILKTTKAVQFHLMSIDTPHVASKPLATRQSSIIFLEEIMSDFKSLEDVAPTEESEKDNFTESRNTIDIVKTSYKKYHHLQDYRRLKSFENHQYGTKFKKLNRSYSLQEMKEHGLQLQPSQKKPCHHQKSTNHALILSEFIL